MEEVRGRARALTEQFPAPGPETAPNHAPSPGSAQAGFAALSSRGLQGWVLVGLWAPGTLCASAVSGHPDAGSSSACLRQGCAGRVVPVQFQEGKRPPQS